MRDERRFRDQGVGLRFWGLGFGVQGSGFRVHVLEFRFRGSGFRDQGSGQESAGHAGLHPLIEDVTVCGKVTPVISHGVVSPVLPNSHNQYDSQDENKHGNVQLFNAIGAPAFMEKEFDMHRAGGV